MELRAVEPRVRLQPVGGDEAGGDEHDHDEPEAERHVARQGALPVGVGVWQQIVADRPSARTSADCDATKRPRRTSLQTQQCLVSVSTHIY